MGEVVWAAGVSHAAGQLRRPTSDSEQDRMDRVFAAWEQLRESMRAAEPDAILVFGTDHILTFSRDLVPTFSVGGGETFETWGEFGNSIRELRGNSDFQAHLHRSLVASSFDVASVVGMRLDHSYACPLTFLDPDDELPVVPITINVFVPPLPSFARCRALGNAVREAIAAQDIFERVAAIGTGGISHAIGVPETGLINPEWDLNFLDQFEAAKLSYLDALNEQEYVEAAGAGAGELACWMAVLGASGDFGGKRLAYEPVDAWLTGMALVEMTVA